jgi:hypothetical protein
MFLNIDGGRSRIYSYGTPQGAIMSCTFLSKSFLGFVASPEVGPEIKAIASTAKQKVDNQVGRQRVGPTCGFVASPEVGPEATIGTLWTRYHYIQVSSQEKL